MGEYPEFREVDVALRDGSTVHIRPARVDDVESLRTFLKGLSSESRRLRFLSLGVDADRMATAGADVDYRDRFALVATAGPQGSIVAHGLYVRGESDRAEIAIAVADAYQGRGLGTIMLGQLGEAAADSGISTFEADVHPSNKKMIDVLRDSGFPARTEHKDGSLRIEVPIRLSAEAMERFEDRERVAAVAAMRTFLFPSSIAVIGASRSRGTIGGEVFHNLVTGGFNGPVYPVNPKAEVVQSVMAYPSIGEVPGAVDLAIVVVPGEMVVETAAECGVKGVRALVVISSGFAEVGEEGLARQRELLRTCREFGMRMIGPNCMGIINTDPNVSMNATFAPVSPPHGRVGFLSQSGALGLAVIDHATSLGLGLSSFVSVGNKADISGNDLLQFWEEDEATDLMLLYLESFGNPRRFSRIARRIARKKPIVAVKSGRSAAGARATSSHTGAVLAASDVTVDALFHQAGVIRTETLSEMFDVASLLANNPPPAGDRVAIVTNAGGPGILCADACEANGLEVGPLPEAVQRELRSFLPAEASVANPIDMIASASADDYRRTLEAVVGSEAFDSVIAIFIPPLLTRPEEVAAAIRRVADHKSDVTLITVFMQAQGLPPELEGIPSYRFPEDGARALARASRYGSWRGEPEGSVPEFADVRREDAAALIDRALQDGPRWLRPDEVAELLGLYGLPLADWRLARSSEEAATLAGELAGPVALKALAPDLVHKTEAGAVALGLGGPDQVMAAAEEMEARVRAAGHEPTGFMVQRMVEGGVEMLVGVVHDPSFGPVLACGAGGTAVELMKDVSVRITPLTDRDADEMLRELKTFPLLEGYRGSPPADLAAIRDVILRLSALVEDHRQIAETDLNPVKVLPDAAVVVDARVRVQPVAPPPPLSARRPG